MDKGHVLSIEAFLVFLGWMLVLSAIWSSSAQSIHSQQDDWKKSRAFETSLAVSDTLIRSHHIQPWLGCAFADESLRRVRSYVVESSCLQRLSTSPPPSSLVARVFIHFSSHNVEYFSRSIDENESCVSLRRPIFLFPEMTSSFLEVLSCA